MRYKNHLSIYLFALFTSLIVCSVSYANKPISIAVDDNYEPYMYTEQDTPKGLYTYLISEIFNRLEERVWIQPLPWKRALRQIDTGISGIAGLYMSSDRLTKYDFSQPLYTEKLLVYTLEDNFKDYKSLNDLSNKTVGLNVSWSYGDIIDKARTEKLFNVFSAKTNDHSLRMLNVGRIDAAIIDTLSFHRLIKKYPPTKKIKSLMPPAAINHVYIAFHKSAQKKKLLDRINAVINKMQEDQSYQRIINQLINAQ